MGRKICIVSGKGGVGKTTITCGLGLALAKNGNSVCLIDLDVGLNNLDVMLNLENKVVYDLGDCLSGKCRLKQALVNLPESENLYLLPSARSPVGITRVDIKKITDKLAGVFDYVLLDAPAGLNENFELALYGANEALVVVTPHVASLRDADKVISRVKGSHIEKTEVVVNRIRGDMVARGEMLGHEQLEKLLKTPLAGVIPESDKINLYSSFRFERIQKSKDVLAFTVLAHNLKTDKKVILDYDSKYRGLLGLIRRNIKRSI